MLRITRSFALLFSLLLLSACGFGSKDDASDSSMPASPPKRGALLISPAPLVN